jgi:hypothetical protein
LQKLDACRIFSGQEHHYWFTLWLFNIAMA